MALSREWIPSPNYSARSGSVRCIVLHTSEGAQDYTSLGNYFKGKVDASSHVGIDNRALGRIGEYVRRGSKAWTQANYNNAAVSAELCTPSGAASGWSESTWRGKDVMLRNAAAWIAEEAAALGIPITKLTSSQAQGSGRGVCEHKNFGSGGGGHTDCGNGFPMDYVLSLARGGAPAPPSSSTPGKAPPLRVDYFGRSHNSKCADVRVWQDKMCSWGWFTRPQVDGIFGPQSEDVAKRFQRQQGLTADGLVGPATWAKTWP